MLTYHGKVQLATCLLPGANSADGLDAIHDRHLEGQGGKWGALERVSHWCYAIPHGQGTQ